MDATKEKLQILHLEDDPQWVKRVQSYLSSSKYEIITEEHLDEAHKLLDERSFDLLLVDISLIPTVSSDEQGLEFIKQIRKDEEFRRETGEKVVPVKIVIFTAYPWRERYRTAFRDYKVSDFLDKGRTSKKELTRALDKVIKGGDYL